MQMNLDQIKFLVPATPQKIRKRCVCGFFLSQELKINHTPNHDKKQTGIDDFVHLLPQVFLDNQQIENVTQEHSGHYNGHQ